MEKDVDESGLRPRGRWSHEYRPIPFHGGYLPIVDVVRAVLGTGYRGWFSVEVFDGKKKGEMGEVAKKAMRMHERLMKEAGGEGGALGECRGDYHSASEEGSALFMQSSYCNLSIIEERKDVVGTVSHMSKELR